MSTQPFAFAQPEIKRLHCAMLERGRLPADPSNCAIYMEATIGLREQAAGDVFGFTVITPTAMSGHHDRRWRRGYLILPRFSWSGTEAELQRLLGRCHSVSWSQVCEQLNRTLLWECEHRQA